MLKHILNNILTTVAGAFAGLPVIIEGVKTGDKSSILAGFGVFVIGLLSKDANK
jgi:hypothetical protein